MRLIELQPYYLTKQKATNCSSKGQLAHEPENQNHNIVTFMLRIETGMRNGGESLKCVMGWLAGWVFAMEALLKVCIQGWGSYWRSKLNRFDFVATMLIVALHFFSFFYQNARYWYAPHLFPFPFKLTYSISARRIL